MKPEELKGRELAAWLRGRVSAFDDMAAGDPSWKPGAQPIGQRTGELAAAEIERLCAEPAGKHIELIDPKVYSAQAARDAAALDEIEKALGTHDESPCWLSEAVKRIIERTGRKVGGP